MAEDLSNQAYQTLVGLVYRHSHIRVGPDKGLMLSNRLRKRIDSMGLRSIDEYADYLHETQDPDEIEELVDLISTNHTHFFREETHFWFAVRTAIPAFLPDLQTSGSPLRLWSAACSSGEEPYTLALVVADLMQQRPDLSWGITASDISNRMLAFAERGIYRMESVEPVPRELLERYFQRGYDAWEGTCRVKAELRNKVHFQRINLFQPRYPVTERQHIIFCRNVLMYFDNQSRAMAVERLVDMLVPGGYLVIGNSESLFGIRHKLRSVQHGVYQLA
ncbi:chemotaxis protein methyltransferase [Comamonadaceae bacterium OS-4]|nr:chemotaxis protein methyltransferase [Comamonadaceae bacterium OS-4]